MSRPIHTHRLLSCSTWQVSGFQDINRVREQTLHGHEYTITFKVHLILWLSYTAMNPECHPCYLQFDNDYLYSYFCPKIQLKHKFTYHACLLVVVYHGVFLKHNKQILTHICGRNDCQTFRSWPRLTESIEIKGFRTPSQRALVISTAHLFRKHL